MRLEHLVTPPITVPDETQYVPVDIGKSGLLTRLQISGVAGVTFDVYSRAFSWDSYNYPAAGLQPLAITGMEAGPAGKLRVTLSAPPPLAVGDLVALSDTSVTGYNSSFRVLALPSRLQVDLDVVCAWTPTNLAAATLSLAAAVEEYDLYRVLPNLEVSALGSLAWADVHGVSLVNTDPWPPNVIRPIYPIYFKFSEPGIYRIALSITRPLHV